LLRGNTGCLLLDSGLLLQGNVIFPVSKSLIIRSIDRSVWLDRKVSRALRDSGSRATESRVLPCLACLSRKDRILSLPSVGMLATSSMDTWAVRSLGALCETPKKVRTPYHLQSPGISG